MKRTTLILILTLGSMLLGLSGTYSDGGIKADSKSTQDDAKKTEQAKEEQKPVFDINGKRFRVDEKYVAKRKLRNGRVIAYRQNKREIAALVKALKEDGVTDKELLNPETWLMILCQQVPDGKCVNGGCDNSYCKASPWEMPSTERVKSTHLEVMIYCRCASLS